MTGGMAFIYDEKNTLKIMQIHLQLSGKKLKQIIGNHF